MAINSGFTHLKWRFSTAMLNYQRLVQFVSLDSVWLFVDSLGIYNVNPLLKGKHIARNQQITKECWQMLSYLGHLALSLAIWSA